MILKASMDTGACYGVKKCAEIVFTKGKLNKGEGFVVSRLTLFYVLVCIADLFRVT